MSIFNFIKSFKCNALNNIWSTLDAAVPALRSLVGKCGILGGKILGPFVFPERLNGATYLNFLRNELPLFLDDGPLAIRRDMFFQHDGCPSHFARNVREFLEVIGRGSLFPWPPRSPDLTVLDFYLWWKLKDIVFATRPTTRQNMI